MSTQYFGGRVDADFDIQRCMQNLRSGTGAGAHDGDAAGWKKVG
jgi:hypothetical protein